MDDDDVQDISIIADDGAAAAAAAAKTSAVSNTSSTSTSHAIASTPGTQLNAKNGSTNAVPPKPPRPLTETQKNEMILKEAFPSVDNAVIKAVLRASGGKVEPAFNALLGGVALEMTDPDAVKSDTEEVPPPQPPRPQGRRAQMSQMEADELYARQLAEHYDNVGAYEARTSNRSRDAPQSQGWDDERQHSFLDDDLPVIRENLRKGFLDTQTKVNGWISNLRKKIEDSFDETEEHTQQQEAQSFRRQGDVSRRSGDYERYDADPQVLSDDFAGIKLSADGCESQGQPRNYKALAVNDRTAAQGRPMVNSGMHRPPPPAAASSRPGNGRRVGFKDEAEEINVYDASPTVPPKDKHPNFGKVSKWQPLSTVEPSPIADNDPFSLGDSEDEKEVGKEKPRDAKTDDNERLKKAAAAEAKADSLVKPADEGRKES
ncbi:hypothetical protein UVI_02061710 [Ustilaginoidea virens]|uniref:CUE domain-containing protein n=1 Tax=Ustilaginoidea virens TaxID=1159556 RepID=A0A1B5L649_USTVR|nr:hypothetical protein UVI_02061710 [Ustilaginoidea virens]